MPAAERLSLTDSSSDALILADFESDCRFSDVICASLSYIELATLAERDLS